MLQFSILLRISKNVEIVLYLVLENTENFLYFEYTPSSIPIGTLHFATARNTYVSRNIPQYLPNIGNSPITRIMKQR